MKDIEINSDKYTGLAVVFVMAFFLVIFVCDLFALARHRPQLLDLHDLHFWDYFIAIFNLYVAVTIYRDTKLRKNYPYGVAGICLMALGLSLRIAAYWSKGFPETQNLLWWSMTIIDIASSGLILAEGVRWFRRKVTLT